MDFKDLCNWFDKLEQTTKRLEMISILHELLDILSIEEIPPAVYLSTGELGPKYDVMVLGFQEKSVMKILSNLTMVPLDVIDKKFKEVGDLGDIVFSIGDKGSQTGLMDFLGETEPKSKQSILDVWKQLEKISKIEGENSEVKKFNSALVLLKDMEPIERKYLVRTLVGKVRLGAKESTWLDATSKKTGIEIDLLDLAAAIRSNIGLVIQTAIRKGKEGIERLHIPKVGIPIMPMLPHRGESSEDIWNRMEGKCEIEIKYDGFRIQVHKSGNKIYLWSRNEESYNEYFPELVKELPKTIKANDVILDGEVVAFNQQTGEMMPFQKLTNRRRIYGVKEIAAEIKVKIFVFDILFKDGKSIFKLPLVERRKFLRDTFSDSELMGISISWSCETPEDIDQQLLEAKEQNREGIMVKSLLSPYEPGKRSFYWLKYKADYEKSLSDTFDLVIVGGWKGRGKRAGVYGTLLMAAYDPDSETYMTFCKLGAGLTEEDMKTLTSEMEELKVPEKPKDVISNLDPDIWVKPKIILEVSGAEISKSPVHTVPSSEGGTLSLRFPRYTGNRRFEKSVPDDVTTVAEINEMAKIMRIGK